MSRELIEREARRRVGALLRGRYRLLRLIGSGGMGAVFEARDASGGGAVAVKLLLDADGDGVARFAREARLLEGMAHPSVVRVFDHGVDEDGTAFLVEELLEGRDLRRRLRDEGPLSPRDARSLLTPILEALSHAHAAGVVHRDVKPENIFLDARGGRERAVLIDFGVARGDVGDSLRSRSGAVIGTPAYMSPEQASGRRPLDARSDVWSVGVVLFECLAGRAPFVGNYHEVLSALLTLDAPPLSALCPACPDDVRDLVARALQRDPSARHDSAAALRDALARCDGFDGAAPYARGDVAASSMVTVRSTRPAATAPRRGRARYVAAALVTATLGVFLRARHDHTPAPQAAAPARPVATTGPVAMSPAPTPTPAPVIAVAPTPPAKVAARRAVAAPSRAPAPRRGANGAPLLSPYE